VSKRKVISLNVVSATLHEDRVPIIVAGEIDLPHKSCCGTLSLHRWRKNLTILHP